MATKNSAWYDSMYNNRALVPNFADHFSNWIEGSKAARAHLTCQLDIAYGDGPNETLDIFPATKANAPVVVFIHGGYWRSLDKSDHSFVAPPLHDMGACVVVVNYALCPGTPNEPVSIPDIAMQMTHALAWVWQNIAKFGGNPKDVVVAGHSAGGHLAAMLLACDWKAVDKTIPAQWIQKALSISGLYDLTPLRKTPFLQESLKLTANHARIASPAMWPRPKKGVLYTVAGGDESAEFLRHNRLIHQTWGPKTVPVCEALPGLNHFNIVTDLSRKGTRLNTLMKQLIQVQS
ncbi:alpha/beta hydrolase [Limnohabitans sp. Rim11]|uniref:alpha/beta hydrolase n=1 Tax=Limnohabitans sp. Rim11 TaxID=1100719 RepID=UPI000A695629|nr:alpha/beta hydrolase [Limnohabitans sp. Rim11]